MPETPNILVARLLGPPQVEQAGVDWSPDSLKGQAIFYYLATTGKPASRDHLTALLWGDTALNNARHSLRSAIYKLRRSLQAIGADNVLAANNDTLHLNWALLTTDLAQFRQLMESDDEPHLRAAVALIRGSFLQGFSLPDALLFDEFLQHHDAAISRSYQQALRRLAEIAELREDWDRAIGDLQALIRVDPLDEQTHQRLMRLYVQTGATALAQRHYRFLERTLEQELHMTPAETTRAIVRTSLEQQRIPSAAPRKRVPFARIQRGLLPLVGRKSPLQRLSAAAAQVAAGNGRTMLIEGVAGIGKSRLVDSTIDGLIAAASDGASWQILQGRCSPFDSVLGYGAFREAFDHLLPLQAGQLDSAIVSPGEAGNQFGEQVLNTLREIARRGPIVLAIDDLHAADPPSLQLFGYLAMHISRLPLLLIGTVQQLSEPAGLRELATVGRRRGDLEWIRLEELSRNDIAEILAARGVQSTAADLLVPWLLDRSSGNPFVLEALLDQLEIEGLLVPHESGQRLDTARWLAWRVDSRLPTTTHDLISLRLTDLAPEARATLEILAVGGERLPLDVVCTAAEQTPATMMKLIETLLGRRLIVEHAETVSPVHDLLRETVLADMSAITIRHIHRQLAIAWEQHQDTERIARHAVAGGDRERAARHGIALLEAIPYPWTGNHTISFLQQLADLVTPIVTPVEQYQLAHALGFAHRSLGRIAEASGWHRRQLESARRSGSIEAEVNAHFELAELALLQNDYSAVIASARQGLARAALLEPHEPAELIGRGYRLIGSARAMEGSDLADAEEHLRRSIETHRHVGNPIHLCLALFELANVLAQQGMIGRAVTVYQQAGAVPEVARSPFLQALIANNLAYHHLLLGQPDLAEQYLTQARTIAEQYGLSSALLHIFSTEGEFHLYVGNRAAAEAAFRHGLAIAEYLGNQERRAAYHAGLALVEVQHGHITQARARLEDALALIAERAFWHLRTRILLWLAELLIDHEPTAVAAYLDTALTLSRSQQRRLLQLQAERLQALQLARHNPAAAQAALVELLDQATNLELSLEIARTRAALARVTLRHAPRSAAGRELLAGSIRELERLGARAEVTLLQATEKSL